MARLTAWHPLESWTVREVLATAMAKRWEKETPKGKKLPKQKR